ncbi:hypothetical protein HC248_01831 [Polaromonas vacuolata]|uniref:Uncharacterized protein n=1 Tax=Polaromonas vacuolata TaxID=37448 RepID=A0A6H2H9I8_9BURK|nr:hypothetical protein [Polaromonas vacuolata]QJC56525.1 hypothetical protein HC248_01831 [Polaromonas vacuolata]
MSDIANIQTENVAYVAPQKNPAVSFGGDRDGSKAGAPEMAPPQPPPVSKPTATIGNNINTTA